MVLKDYLKEEFIGQRNLRLKINFYIESYRKTGIFKNLLIASPRGVGKTELLNQIAKNLIQSNNQPKKYILINGATIKTVGSFVNDIVIPHVSNNQYVTIALDESHAIESKVIDWLLTVLSYSKNNITSNTYDGIDYFFDFKFCSFILATTKVEQLPTAFTSRLKRIEFEPYKSNELISILHKNSTEIKYQENIEKEIISVVRGLPRYVVDIAKDIEKYCNLKGNEIFDEKDWVEFKKIQSIRPLGITVLEYQLLKYLEEFGPRSLTCLAAKLGLDSTTVRRDIESYLISHNLISILGQRYITGFGRRILSGCVE